MDIQNKLTISNLLLSYPQLLELFEKEKIDYYCNGNLSLAELSSQRNYSEAQKEKLYKEIDGAILNQSENHSKINPAYQSLKELCGYINRVHHEFVVKEVQEITELLLKLKEGEESSYPELDEALVLTEKLFNEIKAHLSKEETVFFPLIRYLEDCKRFAEKPHLGRNRPMEKIVRLLESDHTLSTKVIAQIIKTLTTIKTNHKDAGIVKILVKKFERVEKDLHIHIHLENNILFPKGVELENNLYKT